MKTLLFNPYKKFSAKNLLVAGIIITLAGSLMGYCFNVRYDGMLDMHGPSRVTVSIQQSFIDNIANMISIFAMLFISAIIVNKQTLHIYILLASIIYRVPLYFLSFFNYKNKIVILGEEIESNMLATMAGKQPNSIATSDSVIFYSFAILSILLIIWSIALLYNGYHKATASKGALKIILFIVSIIAAEIISKMIVSGIPY